MTSYPEPCVDEATVDREARKLIRCVKRNRLIEAKSIVESMNRKDRKRVTCKKIDGNAALFVACAFGVVPFVNYLLDKCDADVEQRGSFPWYLKEDEGDMVTPLWVCASMKCTDVLEVLLKHGADVNAMATRSQLTPLHTAANGKSRRSMELLIEYGADVNKRSGRGSTCLHCVIQEDGIDAVELLLKHGADVNIKNNAGYDAFHTAIFRGCPEVLAVLTKHSQPSIQRQIEYQELMGTTFASEMDDTAKALQHWRTAMLMRQQHGRMLSPNDTKPPLPVYLHNVEAITPEHLTALAASSDRVVIQSLIVTERLLGPDHERTVSRLMHMGLVCVQSLDYQRGVDVWKYAFHVAQGNLRLHVLQELVLLFLHMDKAHSVHGTSRETVSHEDVSSIFSTICDEVEAASITRTTSKENVRTMVLLLLHVLRLLGRIATEPADVLALRCRVHNLNKIRLVKGRTLLHLALDFQSSSIGDIFYYKFPNLQVVKLLLSCGANVNAVDIGGKNTPLHLCSKLTHLAEKYKGRGERPSSLNEVAEVAEVLVAHGAHVDACNEFGQLASACFSRLPMKLSVPPANRVSLKCLAARAVKRNRIPYEREVPATLNSFIELH